jgi:hypothetical protein
MSEVPKPRYNFSIPMTRKRAKKFYDCLVHVKYKAMTLPVREEIVLKVYNLLLRATDFIPERTLDHALDNKDFHAKRIASIKSVLDMYTGMQLDDSKFGELCWVLAGWWGYLKDGTLYRRWDMKSLVWAPVHITNIKRLQREGRRFKVTLKVLGGPAACMQWEMGFSGGQIQHLIRDVGCRKYDKYKDYDIVGMQFTALLGAAPRESRVKIRKVYSTSSQKKNNKRLCKMRAGACKGPRGTEVKENCDVCRFGRTECPAARFATTFSEIRTCINKHKGYFHPETEDKVCFSCLLSGDYQVVRTKT